MSYIQACFAFASHFFCLFLQNRDMKPSEASLSLTAHWLNKRDLFRGIEASQINNTVMLAVQVKWTCVNQFRIRVLGQDYVSVYTQSVIHNLTKPDC